MQEFMTREFTAIFPKTQQYIYRDKWESGLEQTYDTYTKNMKNNIIVLKNDVHKYRNIEQYFQKIAKKFDKIQIDKNNMGGMPVINNTRIPVSLIVACLKDEMEIPEICEEYHLTMEDIEMAMNFIIDILDIPYQEGWE